MPIEWIFFAFLGEYMADNAVFNVWRSLRITSLLSAMYHVVPFDMCTVYYNQNDLKKLFCARPYVDDNDDMHSACQVRLQFYNWLCKTLTLTLT